MGALLLGIIFICVALPLIWFVIKLIPHFIYVAANIFEFAAKQGFIGIAVFIACWVFMLPVMIIICAIGAIFSLVGQREEEKLSRATRKNRTEIHPPYERGMADILNNPEEWAKNRLSRIGGAEPRFPSAPGYSARTDPWRADSALVGGDDLVVSRALIEELLERPGISDQFRDELEGYKTDMADGNFEARDHRYVRALHARLNR